MTRNGVALGRVSQKWNTRDPGYSLSVLCKKHGCQCMIASKFNPTIQGGVAWLAHGFDANISQEQHKQCFRRMITAPV